MLARILVENRVLLEAFRLSELSPRNGIAPISPSPIKCLIHRPSKLGQLFSQPVQPCFTKRTCLPSLKQITSPKVLAQPLDIGISRQHTARHPYSHTSA